MSRTQCVLALAALCVGMAHSWDIAVSQGHKIKFYTNGYKTNTVRFYSRNLAAIAYDEVHNMIIYVDKQSDNDALCGYILHSKEYKCFIKRNGIHSIALDPVTETLFFTDNNERSINWISLKSGFINNDNGNFLIKLNRTTSDIAVDSCKGYIYWTNTNAVVPEEYIERARLNGSEREVINEYKPVHSIVTDYQTRKIYYFNGYTTRHLCSADLDGRNERIISCCDDKYFSEPKELTVSNDYLYWMNSRAGYTTIWQVPKNAMVGVVPKEITKLHNITPLGIAANYNYVNQIQGCE